MNRVSVRNSLALTSLCFALAACGGGEDAGQEEFKQLSEKYKMKEKDLAAFQVCIDKSAAATPFVKMGADYMIMTSVPKDICGCQTSTISAVFDEKKLGAYGKFLKWVGQPGRLRAPDFKKTDFAYSANAKSIGHRLASTLDSCTRQYIAANEKAGKKLLKPFVDKAKKKAEDDAKAKAAAAAAEKKKSET